MRCMNLAGLAVDSGQDVVEKLDHRHLRAQPPPNRAEFEPDDAGARQRSASSAAAAKLKAPVEETIVFSSISTPGSRAKSDPVAMTIALVSMRGLIAVGALDDHAPGRGDATLAAHPVDLVLLEEIGDAVDVGGDRRRPCASSSRRRSSFGGETTTPRAQDHAPPRRTFRMRSRSALDGMQPMLRQVPPSVFIFSTTATFMPSCAARIAHT